jgi:hypothetical protein
MKTTVQLPDPLVASAKAVARKEHTTLAALVQEGLQRVVRERLGGSKPFKLKDASVKGRGLSKDFESGWPSIRSAIYDGRGG